MEKLKTYKRLVSQGLSTREIATSQGISQTNVRYLLRKFGLKTLPKQRNMSCNLCEKESFGYKHCGSCRTLIRRFKMKLQAVKYLGEKCKVCNLKATEENLYVFDFHHRDSNEKDFAIGNVANKSWDSIVAELSKCDLLCVFCHRKEHEKNSIRGSKRFLNEVKNYKGKMLG